jgi:nucleotide-binding universal stress UspA family protein
MKKILVPFDFSKPAINAYRLALDVAEQSKGVVELLHVVELPVVSDGIIAPVLNFEEKLLKELREKADQEFEKIFRKYPAEKVQVNKRIQFGVVSNSIIEYITDQRIDLVLMGSHGASGLRELFIGSNAEKIVRRSPVPVLVLKDYFKGPVKSIVFPNTLETEKQEDLAMKVKALQDFFGAKLHIVWINTPDNFTSDSQTLARLESFAKRYMFRNYAINIFNYLEEEEGIIEFAKSVQADLIALGTHSRTGIAHIVNGSVAENVVNHSKKMVWTYSMKNESVAAQ